MRFSEIIFKNEISTHNISPSAEVLGIAIKARSVREGYLYIVTNPKKAELDSLTARPVGIICPADTSVPKELIDFTDRCENTLRLASFAYARFLGIDFNSIRFIGITGTNGKTTTATMLKKILTDVGYKVGYIGTGKIEANGTLLSNGYYSMTTPEPDLLYPMIKKMAECSCEVIIMEVSSHALKLCRVEPIQFEYGIFTNLSPEHTDFHTDMEDYFKAKKSLFSRSRVGVFNVDDAYARRAARAFSDRKITVGVLWKGDVYARDVESYGLTGVGYVYRAKKFSFAMRLKLPGLFNVYNSMTALAVAIDMGVLPCKAKASLASLSGVAGRFEIIRSDVTVIIDYAHTDEAFKNILKSINSAKNAGQKLIVVFGCGGERDKLKRPKMAKAAEKYADLIYVTSDNPRRESPMEIIDDITAGFTKDCYLSEPDREAAIRKAVNAAERGDIIAIIGKGAEKYSIDKTGYHDFDERKIVEDALRKRGEKNDGSS